MTGMNMTRYQRFCSVKKMFRRFRFSFPAALPLFLLAVSLCSFVSPSASLFADGAVPTALISETVAGGAGLTRAWFNQVTMDPHHDRVTNVTLQDDTLFITSDNGWIHVVDVKTGNTLWARRVGDQHFYSLPPAANSYSIAVLHGSTVHIYDRFDGKKLLQFQINGPAGGGPQLSERYVYMPILTGKIFAYPLVRKELRKGGDRTELGDTAENVLQGTAKEIRAEASEIAAEDKIEKKGLFPIDQNKVQVCPALGEPLVQPFLCTQTPDSDYFSWVTTSGSLMIGNLDMNKTQNSLKLLYSVMLAPQSMFIDQSHFKEVSLDFKNDINARPTFVQNDITEVNMARGGEAKGGLILMGAMSGYVFAVNDVHGETDWTFPVGRAVIDPIGVADGNCYIPTYTGHFYCLDIKTGKLLWSIRDIKQFISATKNRLYCLDMLGNLLVINRETGQTIHAVPLTTGMRAVFNVESDRIILIGADGLIQCLHEPQFDQIQRYQKSSIEIAEEFKVRIQEVAPERKTEKGEQKEEEKPLDDETKRKIFGDDEEPEEQAEEDIASNNDEEAEVFKETEEDKVSDEDEEEEENPFK